MRTLDKLTEDEQQELVDIFDAQAKAAHFNRGAQKHGLAERSFFCGVAAMMGENFPPAWSIFISCGRSISEEQQRYNEKKKNG